MIVRLERRGLAHGPWVLTTPGDGPVDFIEPTPELAQMLDGESGYFEAERIEGGWYIRRRANADLIPLRPRL